MELMTEEKKGFKRTEVGVIPEDWRLISLDELTQKGDLIRGPFGGALKKDFFVDRGYKVYEQKNAIYSDYSLGNYFVDEDKFWELRRFEIQPDDFIVSCSGTIGRIYQIPEDAPKGIINQALLIIRLDPEKIILPYFWNYFSWENFQDRIIDSTQGGAMKNLVGMDKFRATQIPIPPTLEEQQAIASALSDVDELIRSLDGLIAKKEAIKKGTMQQLLTGKKRLPGFDGEWEENVLNDICELVHGHQFRTDDFIESGSGIKVVKVGTVKDNYLATSQCEMISSERVEEFESFILKEGDILMSLTGNIGRVAKVKKGSGLLLQNYRVGKMVPIGVDSDYLKSLLSSPIVVDQLIKLSNAGAQANFGKQDFDKVKVTISTNIKEQKAIAQILSDMDRELQTLRQKREKYKQVKQGMMQELLTGKVTLV